MTATLGSFYWLGFETSGLSPDKKRLAWLGAQQYLLVGSRRVISGGVDLDRKRKKRCDSKELFRNRVYIRFFRRSICGLAPLADIHTRIAP
jgi:hypothetical protein